MNKKLLLIVLLFCPGLIRAQDSTYARNLIRILTSPEYNGRGYVKNGDRKAAGFLVKEFKRNGLQEFKGSYTQPFEFTVNVFKKTPVLKINNKALIAGKDFVVMAESPSGKGRYPVIKISDKPDKARFTRNPEENILCIDVKDTIKDSIASYTRQWKSRPMHPRAYFFAEDKLIWTARTKQFKEPAFNILRTSLPEEINEAEFEVESKLTLHKAVNVTAMVPGVYPDSFIFVTAHYDHLGRMGNVLFPGANDNASGVSMMMNLARAFASDSVKPKYTMVFVGFAGEEAGLIGSEYMASHPLVPLEQIRFLLNLDLMGSGDEGMRVVNGLKFKEEYAFLDSLNNKSKYLTGLEAGGEARNSDHYPFTQRGVHSFFCFTLGGSKAYHDIYDVCDNITLSRYPQVFALLKDFLDAL